MGRQQVALGSCQMHGAKSRLCHFEYALAMNSGDRLNQIDTHHGLAREAVASYNAASALEWFRGSRAAT